MPGIADVDIIGLTLGEVYSQRPYEALGDHPALGEALPGDVLYPEDDDSLGELDVLGDVVMGDVDILGAIVGETEDDIMGWNPFKAASKAVSGVVKAAKKGLKTVLKSPITKAVAGGVALAFPPVGIPAATALVVADRALQVANGTRGTASQQKKMRAAMANTAALAKRGDSDAKRFVAQVTLARTIQEANKRKLVALKAVKGKGRRGIFVVPGSGKVERGQFSRS